MERTLGRFFGVLMLCGLALPASAATLYLSPTTAELNRGDSVKLSLRLDVDQDECVNAIDGVVRYSENIEPIDISRGASIMSIWVEEPVIDRTNRTITFAGGIPNGYCGRIVGDPRLTNNIVDLIFQSPGFVVGGTNRGTSTDTATVEIAPETQVYLNDGFGTRTTVTSYPATLSLTSEPGRGAATPWTDQVAADEQPPEEFSIELTRSENAFSNRWFITFNTTDKQSGIDHYEVMEEPLADFWDFRWGAVDAPWEEARSPYVLKDQSLNSTIRVRAIDKAGNEYVATLVPEKGQQAITRNALIVYAFAGTFVLVLIGLTIAALLARRRTREQAEAVSSASQDEHAT